MNGDVLTFLLDTGRNKKLHYTAYSKKPKNNTQIFYAKSANGAIKIAPYTLLKFSGIDNAPLKLP